MTILPDETPIAPGAHEALAPEYLTKTALAAQATSQESARKRSCCRERRAC